MTDQEKRKGGGGKLTRSETVTVRLDPKLRYLAELAARKQRRTLSSFVEWAIAESLERMAVDARYVSEKGWESCPLDMLDMWLWDVDEAERLVKLALHLPDFLTHDEQVLWKLIQDSQLLEPARRHKGNGKEFPAGSSARIDFDWLKSLGYPLLRDNWTTFKKIAAGELDRTQLPRFEK